MAQHLKTGLLNKQANIDNYKQKNEWDEICLKDDLSEEKLKQILQEEKIYEEKVYYNNNPIIDKFGAAEDHTFILKHMPGIIKVCYLYVKYNKLDSHPLDPFLLSSIQLLIGGQPIIEINMIINLIFAKMLKLEIIEEAFGSDLGSTGEDNIRIFPIIITTMCGNKFDMSNLLYHQIKIVITINSRIATIEKLAYSIQESNGYNTNIMENIIVDIRTHSYRSSCVTFLKNIKNYLIIGPDDSNLFEYETLDLEYYYDDAAVKTSLMDCGIEDIRILINNEFEIKFDRNDIAEFNIMGRLYYGISLCPELRNKKGLKNFLKGKTTIKKSGLNFSEINNTKIIINSNIKEYRIWTIGFNIFGTYNGLGNNLFIR
jgi:hypothetical protein